MNDCEKAIWQKNYEEYCKTNLYGQMTKKQYFDFVNARAEELSAKNRPLSPELLAKWSYGRKQAKIYAQKRGCDINGVSIARKQEERTSDRILTAIDDIKDLQWSVMQLQAGK